MAFVMRPMVLVRHYGLTGWGFCSFHSGEYWRAARHRRAATPEPSDDWLGVSDRWTHAVSISQVLPGHSPNRLAEDGLVHRGRDIAIAPPR